MVKNVFCEVTVTFDDQSPISLRGSLYQNSIALQRYCIRKNGAESYFSIAGTGRLSHKHNRNEGKSKQLKLR